MSLSTWTKGFTIGRSDVSKSGIQSVAALHGSFILAACLKAPLPGWLIQDASTYYRSLDP
jgi:hypothetical protein